MSQTHATHNGKANLSDREAADLFVRVARGVTSPGNVRLSPELAEGLLLVEEALAGGDGGQGIRDFLANLKIRNPGRAEAFGSALEAAEADLQVETEGGPESRGSEATGPRDCMEPGTPVRCRDRDPANYGTVLRDYGERIAVHFESQSGHKQDKSLPRHQVERTDRRAGKGDPKPAGFGADPPTPRPLLAKLRPVPRLGLELIPEPFRPWLADVSERMGCDLAYPATGVVVGVGSLIGRRVGIRPKRHDDWAVIPNVWGKVVGRPGIMKTPALEEALRFLKRLVAEARKRHVEVQAAFLAGSLVAAAKAEAAKEALKRAAKGNKSESELRALAAEATSLADQARPTLRRYIVNDITIEKLGEIMAENPIGVLQFRDELSGFLKAMDKPGRESDRAAHLEAWNGNGSFVFDRIGRGSTFIDGACESILGGIQPGPLGAYIRAAAGGRGEENDGLLSRFQIAVYPDPPGDWKNVDRWPDTPARNRAFAVYQALDALDPASIGAEFEEGDPVPFLRFDDAAQEVFDAWRTRLENEKLRAEGENPLIESHLAKYRSLMPALALQFHLVEVVDGQVAPGPVNYSAAARAVAWCDFLEGHARRIYECGFEGDPEPGRRLAERIRKGEIPGPFKARDIVRKGWSKLSTAEEVDKALGTLEEHDWIKGVEMPAGPGGGRPTTEYLVNPLALGGKSCKAEPSG